jgi:hypothetical protein
MKQKGGHYNEKAESFNSYIHPSLFSSSLIHYFNHLPIRTHLYAPDVIVNNPQLLSLQIHKKKLLVSVDTKPNKYTKTQSTNHKSSPVTYEYKLCALCFPSQIVFPECKRLLIWKAFGLNQPKTIRVSKSYTYKEQSLNKSFSYVQWHKNKKQKTYKNQIGQIRTAG